MGFGLIKALIPRAAFANRDKILVGITPAPTMPALLNSDIYWHEARRPVSSARLLGTFKLEKPVYFTLPLAADTDVALRTIGRNARGLRTQADVSEAEPDLMLVKGLGGGALLTGEWDAKTTTQTTTADPGSGNIVWNNATLNSATELAISDFTVPGADVTNALAQLGVNSTIYIQEKTDSSRYQSWQVSANTAATGFHRFGVSLLGFGGTPFANNDSLLVTLRLPSTGGGLGTGGHVIMDEGTALAAQPNLNFTGPGVVASNNAGSTRTDVLIQTASQTLEGTVSTSTQDFAGWKSFNSGVTIIDDNRISGNAAVPLVVQWTDTANNGSIQEWWTSGTFPLATFDTQATLRIGRPNTGTTGFQGTLELCDDSSSFTFKLRAGYNPSAQQIVAWPRFTPSVGQVLQCSAFNGTTGDVTLAWASVSSGGGHTIADEGTVLGTQRTVLNFKGAGVVAADNSGTAQTDVTIQTASATLEGCVSTGAQNFAGRKTFNTGVTVIDPTGSPNVPLVVQYTNTGVAGHIQDWWSTGSNPLAWIDTQPNLRLGIPLGADGFLELCSSAGGPTQKIAAGVNPSGNMVFFLPRFTPSTNQAIISTTSGGPNITLGWATIVTPAQISGRTGYYPVYGASNGPIADNGHLWEDTGNMRLVFNDATIPVSANAFYIRPGGNDNGFYVHPTGASTGSPFIYLDSSNSHGFEVDYLGNIKTIAGIGTYKWPTALPTTGQVLAATNSTGTLAWTTPTGGGGVTGTGTMTASYLTMWSTAGATGTITNSPIYDGLNASSQASIFVTRDFLYGRADGTLNLGDSNNRISSIYIKNAFWMTAGGSAGGPTSLGFLNPTDVGYSRFLINGGATAQAGLQSGSGCRTTLASYNAIELRGNTQTSIPNVAAASSDTYGVLVWQQTDKIPLLIDSQTTLTQPLLVLHNAGTEKFRITAQGTIVAQGAGTILGVATATTSFTMTPQHRTILADTASGGFTITLPVASGCRGQIYDIIHQRALQYIFDTSAPGSGNAVRIQVTSPDSLNNWDSFGTAGNGGQSWDMSNTSQKRAIKLIADATLNVWWLLPYNI